MNVIEVNNLNFSYHKEPVLKDVSFKVEEKEFLVIVGPNGGGKSTLLKILLGLLPPNSGSVRIFGKSIHDAYSRIGYVPQDFDHIKHFPITVMDTVLMEFYKSKLSKSRQIEMATEKLEILGMSTYQNARLNELSTGQRQRVFLARATVNNPDLLILDEPVSGVDPQGQKLVLEMLANYNKTGTILFVSHNLDMIPVYATSVLCVERRAFYHPGNEFNHSSGGIISLLIHDRERL